MRKLGDAQNFIITRADFKYLKYGAGTIFNLLTGNKVSLRVTCGLIDAAVSARAGAPRGSAAVRAPADLDGCTAGGCGQVREARSHGLTIGAAVLPSRPQPDPVCGGLTRDTR